MEPLALNAISTIIVNGLTANDPITLTRRTAPLDLVPPLISPPSSRGVRRYGPPPPRVHAQLPPPGDVSLTLTLEEDIGSGGTGRVYSVNVSGPAADGYHIPPLVAKVARRGRRGHLAREAWFYDELAVLQGVSIARCYGWFEAEVSDEGAILPWVVQSKNGPEIDSMSPPARAELKSWGRDLYALGTTTNVVSILLLERLSDERMPSKVKLDDSFRKEVLDTYNETGHLGVQIRDIRWANTLRAPDALPGHLPSLPSPFTNQTHPWRIVDLERCVKLDISMKGITYGHFSWLRGLFNSLQKGQVFESWMVPPSVYM